MREDLENEYVPECFDIPKQAYESGIIEEESGEYPEERREQEEGCNLFLI